MRRSLQRTAVSPPEFFGQCCRQGCRAHVSSQATVGGLRESYTEEARFRRIVTGILQQSDRDYSAAIVLPDLYPQDLVRVVDERRRRVAMPSVCGVIFNVFTTRWQPGRKRAEDRVLVISWLTCESGSEFTGPSG
eukprot:1389574-Pleurochrysis_carterae.AAC.1